MQDNEGEDANVCSEIVLIRNKKVENVDKRIKKMEIKKAGLVGVEELHKKFSSLQRRSS
jgi:hypothetical protein